jgi:hypothetical protein
MIVCKFYVPSTAQSRALVAHELFEFAVENYVAGGFILSISKTRIVIEGDVATVVASQPHPATTGIEGSYNRFMITAVRSSCCLVPLENIVTAS